MDEILLTRNVMFIGDYFTLIHTVVLHEELRQPDEHDEDMAVRLASEFFLSYYGFDIAAASTDIGVMDEDS